MNKTSTLRTAARAAAALGATASLASAASIAVNFQGAQYSYGLGKIVSSAGGTPFGVAASGWSTPGWYNSATATGSSVTDSNGTTALNGAALPSGVSVAWTCTNTWNRTANPTGWTGNDAVLYGQLDDGGSGADITISGLSAWLGVVGGGKYTVQVILSTAAGSPTDAMVSPILKSASTGGTTFGGGTTTHLTSSFTTGTQQMNTWSGLTSDTLFIDGQTSSGGLRGSISGFIISIPEPSSWLTASLGAFALLKRRRR